MTRRVWVLGIAVLIVTAAGVGLLIRTYRHAPLQRTAERTCIGCVTWFWNGAANVRANRLSGGYAFTDEASYLVSFGSGSVTLAGERLTPGCHEGRADAGVRLAFDGARDVRVRVPAPEDGCDARNASGG